MSHRWWTKIKIEKLIAPFDFFIIVTRYVPWYFKPLEFFYQLFRKDKYSPEYYKRIEEEKRWKNQQNNDDNDIDGGSKVKR